MYPSPPQRTGFEEDLIVSGRVCNSWPESGSAYAREGETLSFSLSLSPFPFMKTAVGCGRVCWYVDVVRDCFSFPSLRQKTRQTGKRERVGERSRGGLGRAVPLPHLTINNRRSKGHMHSAAQPARLPLRYTLRQDGNRRSSSRVSRAHYKERPQGSREMIREKKKTARSEFAEPS